MDDHHHHPHPPSYLHKYHPKDDRHDITTTTTTTTREKGVPLYPSYRRVSSQSLGAWHRTIHDQDILSCMGPPLGEGQ